MADETDSLEEALLEELRLLCDELGVPPRTIDMGKHGRFSPGLYSAEFGSWKEALETAGIEGEPRRPPEPVEVELDERREEEGVRWAREEDVGEGRTTGLEEAEEQEGLDKTQRLLLRNAERMERVPAPDDLRRRGYSVNEILEEYGTWVDALASVGIEVAEHPEPEAQKKRRRRSGRRDRLLEEVRKYEGVHGEVPTRSDVEATEWMSPLGEYTEEFGALWRAVDVVRQATGGEGGTGPDAPADEDREDESLERELKLYYLRNGEVPTRDDVRADKSLSDLSAYIDAFGDLRAAVESAGILGRTKDESEGENENDNDNDGGVGNGSND